MTADAAPAAVEIVVPPAPGRPVHAEPAVAGDSCARLHWDRGQRLGSYRACGYAGFLAGFALVLAVSAAGGAARAVTAAVVVTVPLSFLVAVKMSQLVFGYERIVFFEKALFALGATALALWLLGWDVATGLDLATLGIGTFLGFGRVGCFMVGCCHGRPSRWGTRYGVAHAQAGFPWYYVGRRIFPLQLVDGAVSLALVCAGVETARSPHPPGSIAAGYLLWYSSARFVEEMFRGDAARAAWLGVSEAQWTAGLVAIAVAAIGHAAGFSHPHIALALWASVIAVALARRSAAHTAWGLTSPWHIDELNRIVLRLDRGAGPIESSQRLWISMRTGAAPGLRDYVLSFPDRPLPLRVAAALLDHVRFDRHPGERAELRAGATPGLVHVVVSRGPRRGVSP